MHLVIFCGRVLFCYVLVDDIIIGVVLLHKTDKGVFGTKGEKVIFI